MLDIVAGILFFLIVVSPGVFVYIFWRFTTVARWLRVIFGIFIGCTVSYLLYWIFLNVIYIEGFA